MPTPVLFADSIASALGLLNSFLINHGATLPDFVRDKLTDVTASPSPVDRIVAAGELLYANADDVGPEGRAIAGTLIHFATLNSWHGLSEDNRGGRILMAMQRDNDMPEPAGMPWPTEDTDPAAKPEMIEQPAEPLPTPPVVPAPETEE